MGVCTKERKGVTAEVLRATPCTNSLGGENGEQKHEGCGGRSACWRSACWKFAAVPRVFFFCFSSFFPTANLTATSTQREERDGKQVVFGRWLRRGRVYA